jgi:hypothetical protein
VKIGEHTPPILPALDAETPRTGAAPNVSEGGFAERLARPEAPEPVAARPAGATVSASAVELGGRVERGELSAAQAIETLIERTLDAQLGKDASPALKEQARTLIAHALESDPVLSALVKQVGGRA